MKNASFNGLSETLMDHFAPLGLLVDQEALITLASRIDEKFCRGQRHGLNPEFFQFISSSST